MRGGRRRRRSKILSKGGSTSSHACVLLSGVAWSLMEIGDTFTKKKKVKNKTNPGTRCTSKITSKRMGKLYNQLSNNSRQNRFFSFTKKKKKRQTWPLLTLGGHRKITNTQGKVFFFSFLQMARLQPRRKETNKNNEGRKEIIILSVMKNKKIPLHYSIR